MAGSMALLRPLAGVSASFFVAHHHGYCDTTTTSSNYASNDSNSRRRGVSVEVCLGDAESVAEAVAGGADRVELCAALGDGGTTPSLGAAAASVDACAGSGCRVHCLVRPRAGDFVYSAREVDAMARDVAAFRDLGVDGVVVGALRSDGSLDDAALRRLVAVAKGQRCRLGLPKTAASPAKPAKPAKLAAGGVGGGRLEFLPPMTVTFHRAFDVCADAEDTLRRLHRLRVRRSGGFLSDDVDSLFDAFDDGDGDRTGTQGPDEEEERQEKEKREKKRPDESVGDGDNPLFGVGADSEGTKRRRTRRTSRAKEAQEGGWVHGVDMVLTSGQAASAWEGRDRLRRLQEVLDRLNGAAGSSSRGSGGGDSGTFLRLMAGAGVHAGNASAIADYVGLADVHAGSALMDDVLSATAQHQQRLKQQQQVSDGGGGGHGSGGSSVSGSGVSMGPGSKGREHLIRRTAASKVRALVASLEK